MWNQTLKNVKNRQINNHSRDFNTVFLTNEKGEQVDLKHKDVEHLKKTIKKLDPIDKVV